MSHLDGPSHGSYSVLFFGGGEDLHSEDEEEEKRMRKRRGEGGGKKGRKKQRKDNSKTKTPIGLWEKYQRAVPDPKGRGHRGQREYSVSKSACH